MTRTYVWPMPRVEDIFSKLGKARCYTTLDLRSGYHHIAVDEKSIKKTPFVAPFAKYGYLKVPFVLVQAPAYFQNLMNKVLNGLNFTLAYLNDIIIFSETAEQHLKHVQIMLTSLKQAKLKLKKNKCAFSKKELHYLGHLLTTEGIKPQTEKINPFAYCYKLHVHTDAFLAYYLYVYKYHYTSTLMYPCIYVSIYLHVCIDVI